MRAEKSEALELPGRAEAPPGASPSPNALRWLIRLRLVVVSTLFLGALIIQASTRKILPLSGLYSLFLLAYVLSLLYLTLHLKRAATRLQVIVQLLGDLAVVTGFVYVTGGLDSPFSFLYLTVIVLAAVLLRGGALIFAGLSAVTYGVLVDLMFFELVPVPANLVGVRIVFPTSRVLYQLMIHVVGFLLVALLASYLSASTRAAQDRLRAERERATRFAALTDHVVRSMGAGIVAADLDGAVLHINPAGARILGIREPDEVMGRSLWEIMPMPDHDWPELLARARNRAIPRMEGQLAGSATRLGLSVGPLEDEQEDAVGYVVNFQDLSEVELLLEQRRLQERMAAVGELASRMAHEIKNPLASISGSAQVLASLEGTDDAGSRLLQIVVDESQRLSSVLDGFLSYARPASAEHRLCDLSALLKDCTDLLRRSGEMRGSHEMVLDIPDRLEVVGDANQLRQVFWNLARNALQAMPDGGTLRIEARCGTDTAMLRWLDSGGGMPAEIRQRAFEPFVTSRSDGTGLGLAIVYSAVQEHGGTVNIDSQPGRGTTVTIELPTAKEA